MAEQNSGLEPASAVGGSEGAAAEDTTAGFDRSSTEVGSQRYVDIQAAYTQSQQELNEFRNQRDEALELNQWYEVFLTTDDPDIRQQAAEVLGLEFDDGQPQYPDESGEQPDPYDSRIQALEQRQSQADAEQAEIEHARIVREVLDERLDALDGLDKDDQDWVLSYAMHALETTDEGLPDIQGAYEVFRARETARQKAWADQKRMAPVFPAAGQEGVEAPNLDNDQERQAYMAARLQAGQQI